MFEVMKFSVSATTQAAVQRLLRLRGDERSMAQVAEEALQAWLEKAACENPPEAQQAARGYQWKSLFLPHGTLLRFHYKREVYTAEVRGNHIEYQGRSYSPRQLLMHITGAVRNAWRELWLRSPGDFRWHLADTRRRILRRAPSGQHPCGIDAGVHGSANAYTVHLASRLYLDVLRNRMLLDESTAALCVRGYPNIERAARTRAILYRDDIVRADQPDLASRTAGGGPARAGRTGPHDRRYVGHLYETHRPLCSGQLSSR